MKRIIFSLVIVAVLVMMAVLAANLPPATVAEPDPLCLECLPDESFTTTIGNVTNFEAGASGGVPPYDWLWTVNGDPVASLNNTFSTYTNYTRAFNELGLYTVCVNVTDSVGNSTRCCKNATVIGPLLTIAKIDTPDPVNAGGTLNYTITVTNNGTANATNVTIVDNYDETVLNITDTDGGVDDGDTITWDGGIIIPSGGGFLSYNISATVSPTAPGGFIFNAANVTCAEGVSNSTSTNTTVIGALNLTCNVSPNPTKVGHVTNFTAGASGGAGNYTWSWTVNGTWVSNNQNITYNFTGNGNYTVPVCVNVTDLLDNKEQCCTDITVNPALSLECDVSPNTTRVDQAINCTAAASGGVGNYTWLWMVNGTEVATTQNTTYNFTAVNHTAGVYNVCVNVTDSLVNKEQCCTNVTVTGPLNLTCNVTPNPTKGGHLTNFNVTASGGIPPYSYAWDFGDSIGSSADEDPTYTYAISYTTARNYTVCVNVTDSSEPKQEKQCCMNVTVNKALSMECNVGPTTTKVGNAINGTAAASGGVPPYDWLWTVNGTEVASFNNTGAFTNITHAFNETGVYEVCVNVTGSLGNKKHCCTNVTVTGDLSLVCNVTPNPTKGGHPTNFNVTASGGVPPYSYAWDFGDSIGSSTDEDPTYTYIPDYTTTWNYTVCVNVTDSSEPKQEKQCCMNVTVNKALSMECNVGPTTTKVGNAINGTAAASGGVPPYDWLWTVNGTELASFNNTVFTNITHSFNETGVYEVCVNVTDYLGNKEQCCTNVTVNPALSLVLSPATDTNLIGTFHLITATVYDQFDDPKPGVNLTWSISGVGNFSGTPGGITNGGGKAYTEITSSTAGTSRVTCAVLGNPSISDIATKTWIIPERPPSGGGGGCPPIEYLTVDWDGKNTTKRLRSNDELALELLGPSPDGRHSLLLEQDTHAPVVDGETYYIITIRELGDIPPLPENTEAIMAFDVTPTGAVFNKDIFLTLGFYQSQLPEDALEGTITIAYYGDVSGVWVPLDSTEGERDGMLTLSAAIDQLNIFAVLVEVAPAPPPPPARFVVSGLNIEPSVETGIFVTKTGESVTITANIANDGGQEGTYTVELKLDGETIDTEIVTLSAGQSQQVSFTVSGLGYGQHDVEVDGLSDEFTTSRTITWWLIIVIIVAVGLIIWGVLWFRRRRKARQAA
jgi:uncharacterized repeat protein (TIGR01451 family)